MDSNKSKVYEIVKNHFSFEEKSLRKFKELLENPFVDPLYKKILGDSLRKEFPVTRDTYEEIDKGWIDFKNRLPNLVNRFHLTYKNFRTNKIVIDRQEIRMYKHFADYYQTHKDELNKDISIGGNVSFEQRLSYLHSKICECQDRKIPKGEDVKIVFSMDFADWFLCSTGESWSSCISLESHYEGAMWSGLPGLAGDPNRAMLYVTDGKKKTYNGIEVDRMLSRTFTLIGNDDKIYAVRFYPSQHFNTETINAITKIGLIEHIPDRFISKHKITPLYHKNGYSSFTYQDYVTADKSYHLISGDGGGHFYFEKGKNFVMRSGSIFSYDGGLAELIAEKKDLGDAKNDYFCCIECGNETPRDEAYYGPNGGEPYCDECYHEYYFVCSNCDDTFSVDDKYIAEDEEYCPNCFKKYFKACYHCGTAIDKAKTVKYHTIEDITYCKKCFKKQFPEKFEEIFPVKNEKAG
jgi:hypothetical protein